MILYSVVARSTDGVVLVEATIPGVEGNHPQVTSQLLQELVENPSLVPIGIRKTFMSDLTISYNGRDGLNGGDIEMTYNLGGTDYRDILGQEFNPNQTSSHVFHVVQGESLYFICLSDDSDGLQQRVNFGFLLSVQKEFCRRYTPNRIINANAYGFEKGFSKNLSEIMHHFNTNRYSMGVDPNIAKLTSEVESLKKIMGVNIDLLMARGHDINSMVKQSDNLLMESKIFSKRGKRLKRVMKTKAFVYKTIIVGFFLITIYLMIASICGFNLSCSSSGSQ